LSSSDPNLPSNGHQNHNPDHAGGIAPPLVDLHLHTTASDGQLTPTELIDQVARTSLRIVAVTDHDSTEGIAEALAAAERYPDLTVIPGIELGTEDGESEVHLLSHFVDPDAPGLQDYLNHLRAGRVEAAKGTVKKLDELGIHIEWERVLEIAGGAVGRPHIARAMEEAGYVENAQDAFQRYLGSDGLARVKRPKPTPGDGVMFLHSIGATATLAHPQTVRGLVRILGFLIDEGLDGIEVFAPKYGTNDRVRRLEIANRNGLIAVGGSDYHAWGSVEEIVPGDPNTVGPPLDAVDRLRAASERWKSLAPEVSGGGAQPAPGTG
jgi:predicted metal-dependent phosphoesterase TrpH